MRYTEKDLKTKYDNFTDYLSSIIELLILSPFRLINEISKKVVYLEQKRIEKMLLVAAMISVLVIALSWYRSPYTIKAIKLLLAEGIKTNIHYVLSKSTLTEALQHLQRDLINSDLAQSTSQSDLLNGRYDSTELRYFPKGINAVIFLLHKPVGLGTKEDMITRDNKDFFNFLHLVNEGKFPYKIGFDSCTVPALINLDKVEPNCLDTCEGARWSAYITSDMKLLPCSFDNQAQRWAVDLAKNTIAEAWESDTFEDFRNHFVQSCPGCKHRTKCMGGCPIVPEIVLCKDKESEN